MHDQKIEKHCWDCTTTQIRWNCTLSTMFPSVDCHPAIQKANWRKHEIQTTSILGTIIPTINGQIWITIEPHSRWTLKNNRAFLTSACWRSFRPLAKWRQWILAINSHINKWLDIIHWFQKQINLYWTKTIHLLKHGWLSWHQHLHSSSLVLTQRWQILWMLRSTN